MVGWKFRGKRKRSARATIRTPDLVARSSPLRCPRSRSTMPSASRSAPQTGSSKTDGNGVPMGLVRIADSLCGSSPVSCSTRSSRPWCAWATTVTAWTSTVPPDPERVGPFPELLLDAERGLQVPLCLIALVDPHAQLADPGMGHGPHPRCLCLLVLERLEHPPGGLQRAVQVALVLPQVAGEAVGDPGQHRLVALAQRLQCGGIRPQELGRDAQHL